MSLDETLKFEALPSFQAEGDHPLNATVPSPSGLQWIAVPSDCVGLAFRIESGSTLQLIRVEGETTAVLLSIRVAVAVVYIAASNDGRLVCLACSDGTLRCYNATQESFSERWILPDAHSHVVLDLNESASNSRDFAASAAGPLRSLQFEPKSYKLLLVDAGRQTLTFVHGDSTTRPLPNVIDTSYQVTCAAWAPGNESVFAMGKSDGTIEIFKFSSDGANQFGVPFERESKEQEEWHLVSMSLLDFPVDEDDEAQGKWVCTHLQWLRTVSLAVGYSRVASGEDEDEDEDRKSVV